MSHKLRENNESLINERSLAAWNGPVTHTADFTSTVGFPTYM